MVRFIAGDAEPVLRTCVSAAFDYQLNLRASCIFLAFPAAFTVPKRVLLEGDAGAVRQAVPCAVRNGVLKMLYISARNCNCQGPEPHGPLSVSSVSLTNDQSKFVRLFMRTLFLPQVPSLPTNGWLNPEMLAGGPRGKGVPAGSQLARVLSRPGEIKLPSRLTSGTASGPPLGVWTVPARTVAGTEDCHRFTDSKLQPSSPFPATPFRPRKNGTCQTSVTMIRWRISKLETARSAASFDPSCAKLLSLA